MQKSVMASVLAAGLSLGVAYAGSAPMVSHAPSFTGAYAGMDVGFRSVSYTSDVTVTGNNADQNDITDHITQPTEGIHLGYGYEFENHLYLGSKAFLRIAQGRAESTSSYGGGAKHLGKSQQFGNTYGLNVEFGDALTDNFLPYVVVGYTAMNIKDDLTPIIGFSGPERLSLDKYAHGVDAGLGMHYRVAPHVLLNAEFTGAWLSSISKTDTNSTSTMKNKISPDAYTGLVGFSYLF